MTDNTQKENLSILRIGSGAMLEKYIGGLSRLYSDVFAEPPYLENFSLQESAGIFKKYVEDNGILFVALDSAEKPVAFSVAVPYITTDIMRDMPDMVTKPDKVVYVADAGVEKGYRRQNLSVLLKKRVLETARAEGYKGAISRTSQESYKQISAFNKVGGFCLKGAFQDVASRRIDGMVTTDRRVFYAYDLDTRAEDAAGARKLTAKIFRKDGKDTAYIKREWPPKPWVKEDYPGLSRVKYGLPGKRIVDRIRKIFGKASSPGQEIFSGNLYLRYRDITPSYGVTGH